MAEDFTESEVFRFVCQRPIQQANTRKIEKKKAKSYGFINDNGAGFHQELATLAAQGNLNEMLTFAQQFISLQVHTDFAFVKSLEDDLETRIWEFSERIYPSDRPISYEALLQIIEEIFSISVQSAIAQLINSPEYQRDRRRIGNSLITVTIDSICRHKHRDQLVQALRACRLLERIAEEDPDFQEEGGIEEALQVMVVLPPDVFPLPVPEQPEPIDTSGEVKESEREEKIEHLRRKLADLKSALKEFENIRASDFAPPPVPKPESEDLSTSSEWKPWVLSKEAVDKLSDTTKAVLREAGMDFDNISLTEVVTYLEAEIARTGAKLYRPSEPLKVIRYGSSSIAFRGKTGRSGAEFRWTPSGRTAPSTEVTVPEGAGSIRPIGIADLMLVRQKLLRYEKGEIAHIENVLRGEYKERLHRRARRIEEEITVETERKEETERDLQTAERFEIKRETSETIKEDSKLEAGVSVSGSYGPTVSFSANTNYSNSEAKEKSKKVSTSYARDVTERSVSRFEERVREERVRRTVEEFEETNTHGIDNKEKDGHVIGIYRWVDKIYEAQVVNYGRRTLYEFIVPEPAAFYLHAMANKPTLEEPEPPVVDEDGNPPSLDDDSEGRPLEPQDITLGNYQYWVSKYRVSGVKTPPAHYKIIGDVIEKQSEKQSEDENNWLVGTKTIKITEDGYTPVETMLEGRALTIAGVPKVVTVIYGTSKVNSAGLIRHSVDSTGLPDCLRLRIKKDIPIAVIAQFTDGLATTVYILCERTKEKFADWQLETYDAIIQAYLNLKADYEEQLSAAAIQEGISISGRNPAQNREIEQTEIKKAAISIVTAQHFELFDAMRQVNDSSSPEMDFDEAEAEGRYIQFFEQAFEWPQMTYRFYPYFWGRKENWIDKLIQIQDTDPLFEQFLKAGAARVVVPVRPGYEDAALHFLETKGKLWCGGDPPHVDEELYVSIVDDLKEQLGAGPEGKKVGEPWEVRIPTSLVILQQDSNLPSLSLETLQSIVDIVSVSTGKPYSLARAELGALPYIDRDYTITDISAGLDGGVLVRPDNDDKSVNVTNHLVLRLYKLTVVYVCYDKRGAATPPTWLNDGSWIRTDESILTTDGSASPMLVFKKAVAAGDEITLGGNHKGGGTDAESNYFVIVKS